MTKQAEQIKSELIKNPGLSAIDLLAMDYGNSELEIDFIIEQLKTKGEI